MVDTKKAPEAKGPKVKWSVDNLKSSYVNFANANSTKEEVVLNFGLNTSWDRASPEVEIEPRQLPGRDAHPGRLLTETGNRGPQGHFARGNTGEPELAGLVGERLERRAFDGDPHLFQVVAGDGI
jgi:hypothetical protein